jgi:hypothetical protein
MPIVNVNFNLNLTNGASQAKRKTEDKFNWGTQIANMAAAAKSINQDQLSQSMLGLQRMATHSPFLNREKLVHQMQSGMEMVIKNQQHSHPAKCEPSQEKGIKSALAQVVSELDGSFESDPMFGDSDIEEQARQFDRRKKSPAVHEVSDDDKKLRGKKARV